MGIANSQPLIEVDYSKYIGNGSFGNVYRGTFGKQPVAVKIINIHMLKNEYKNIDKNELIPYIKGLKHPNLVTIFAWEDKGHEIWLALDLCEAGLDKYLKDHDPSTDKTWDIIWQCADGLCYLHRNNVVHRDVKPDNFLVVMENGRAVMKVTDFSLCKDVDSELGSTMATVRGNRHWLAPELLTEGGERATEARYKRSIDVFSFALVIVYICVNNTGREKLSRACCGAKVRLGEDVLRVFDELWRNTDLKDMYMPLLRRMMQLDPDIRSTMEDVMSVMIAFRPPTVYITPRLETSHRLGYQAHRRVGIGGRHLILLGCWDSHTLRLLQLQGDGYNQLWEKDCPQGVHYVDRKYVVGDDSLITHLRRRDPTRCFSREFTPLHTHTVGFSRVLIAVLPDHRLAYRELIDGGWQLVLRDGDRRVCTLQPPAGTRWGAWLSMCQHPTSGWMAVTEKVTDTLTVLDGAGQVQHSARLDYKPCSFDAITSTAAHLVVSEYGSTVLHFHAWDGQEVGRLDLRQVAALGEGEKWVYSVGVCDDDMLHVAVGGESARGYYVTSLHALKM